jgi:hypothetical protein
MFVLALVFASWVVALVGYIGCVKNLSGRKSASDIALNGFQLWVAANFTDVGLKWRRVHFVGLLAFVSLLIVLMSTSDMH